MNEIPDFLNRNFKQPYENKRVWTNYRSWNDKFEDPWGELNKEYANRNQAYINIHYHGDLGQGHEITIQLFLSTDMEWEKFFEGFVPDLATLKIIFNCIGIKYTE